MENQRLCIHRSWTGNCLYEIQFARQNDVYVPMETLVNRDSEQYANTEPERDLDILSQTIDHFLLDY